MSLVLQVERNLGAANLPTVWTPRKLNPAVWYDASYVPSMTVSAGSSGPVNLFDSSAITMDWCVQVADGTLTSITGQYTSAYISVIPGSTYCFRYGAQDSNTNLGSAYYDANKVFVSSPLYFGADWVNGQTITVPTGVAFIRFSGQSSNTNFTPANDILYGQMFLPGTTVPASFIAYTGASAGISLVSAMADLSGNNLTLGQTDTTAWPKLFGGAINALTAIGTPNTVGAGNALLAAASARAVNFGRTNAFTAWAVIEAGSSNPTAKGLIAGFTSSSNGWRLRRGSQTGFAGAFGFELGSATNLLQVAGGAALTASTPHKVVVTYDGAGNASLWVDGTAATATVVANTIGSDPGLAPETTANFGVGAAGTTAYSFDETGEFGAVAGVISGPNLTLLHSYLHTKWGI